jgi:purine-binding chemotaxis protein CheW
MSAVELSEDFETEEELLELENKFLIFSIDDKDFALRIKYITEIVGILPVTEIPNMPSYMRGIINLRGKGIPVIDVRLRFGNEAKDYTEKTCIIIVNWKDQFNGLIVDGVREVIFIPEDSIEPAIDFKFNLNKQFVEGLAKVGDRVKILVDTKKLVLRK